MSIIGIINTIPGLINLPGQSGPPAPPLGDFIALESGLSDIMALESGLTDKAELE